MNERITWSGTCSRGLAEGTGDIKWVYGSDLENSTTGNGQLLQGKMDGRWVTRDGDGTVGEGSFVAGERHGQWVFRYANGNVIEGPYVDGKRHGQWVLRWDNIKVIESTWIYGIPVNADW